MRQKRWLCLLVLPLFALLGAREAALPVMEPQARPCVAMTFDDSPNAKVTERLLDGLKERGAHATFFIIGEQIAGQEALLRRMAEEGHQIGNHTYTHRRLDNSGAVGAQELARTERTLAEVLGGSGYWVRPPWGFASAETLRETNVPLVYWSLDTEDWRVLDAEKVARCILDNVRNGDVVLLHDSYETSVDAALQVIDTLTEQGYAFLTLEELFEHMGVTPCTGCLYCRPDQLRSVK